MKQDIAILTFSSPKTKSASHGSHGGGALFSPGLESLAATGGPDAADIEIHSNVSTADLNDINRDPQRIAAPVMPLRLIEPYSNGSGNGAAAAPLAGSIAWGVRAVGADQSSATGAGITVAVLDTGIQKDHPAFSGITEWITEDFTGSGGVNDTNGHGTHCAGTIFGRDVNGTRIGVAPGITRAVIGKVLGGPQGGDSGQLARAMRWAADNGASIISMSLGIDFPGYVKYLTDRGMDPRPATSMALEAYRANIMLFEKLAAFFVAQAAFAQSVLVVAATGNESARNKNPSPYTINLSPPAAAPGIMGVAAVAQDGATHTVAGFSNTGAAVAAPGVDITSAWPGSTLNSISGTSMATPHVAGVAALWAEQLSQSGNLNSDTLRAKVIATAKHDTLTPGWSVADVGSGLVRAPQ